MWYFRHCLYPRIAFTDFELYALAVLFKARLVVPVGVGVGVGVGVTVVAGVGVGVAVVADAGRSWGRPKDVSRITVPCRLEDRLADGAQRT